MVRIPDHSFDTTLPGHHSPGNRPDRTDAEDVLLTNLPPTWDVTRGVDPHGSVSLVVFPIDDAGPLATFVLYEGDGFTEVATIRNDVWEGDQRFNGCAEGVTAILARVHEAGYRA